MRQAIRRNSPSEIFEYLEEGEDINSITNDGTPLLYWAAMEGYSELVQFLLNKGANIEITDSEFSTPIMVALLCQNYEIFYILLNAGANPNKKDFKGNTCMKIAALRNRLDIIEALKSFGVKASPTLDEAIKIREKIKANQAKKNKNGDTN
jgi:uncharacterized protein